MIEKLLNYKKIVLFVVIAISVMGVLGFQNIAKKEFPNTAIPVINVSITAPGYSSEEIDETIVPEIEDDIKQLEGVDQVYSYSFDNGGMIVVQFELDVLDVSESQDDLDKALKEDGLNDDVTITTDSDFKESHVVYAITGEDAYEASEEFKKQIEDVENVKSVELSNDFDNNLVYTVDKDKLDSLGISYSDFIALIGGIGTDVPLGYLSEDDDSFAFLTTNSFTSAEDIENYELIDGLTLGDLGTVSIERNSQNYYEYEGEEAIFLNIYFEDNIDFTQVGEDINQLEDDFEYDGDYSLNQLVFQPDSVNEQINSVFINLVQAVILVVIIVIIGLGFRNSILIGLSLPFTILTTIAILKLMGQDLQQISIAGLIISIGIVVDNAIVVNDAITHKLDEGKEKRISIVESVKENFIPVLTSTATTIAAFTPIMFLSGIAGVIAFSLPVTVIIALIVSFIYSLIITPLLADSFIKASKHKDKKVKKTREFKFIRGMIKKPYISVIIILVVLVLTGITALSMQIVVFPTADKDIIYVEYTNNQSTNLEDTKELNKEIIDFIDSRDYLEDEVEDTASVIGGRMPQFYATLPTLPLLPNQGFIYMNITDKDQVTDLKNQLSDDLEEEFGDVATIKAKELELNLPTAPISLTISGENTDDLVTYEEDIYDDISAVEGVKQVDVSKANKVANYELVINDDVMSTTGLTNAEISQEVALLLNDYELDVIDSEEYTDNLVIRSDINTKEELLDTNFIIDSTPIPASSLFTIKEVEAYDKYTNINYENSVVLDVWLDEDVSVISTQDEIDQILSDNEVEGISYSFSGEMDLITEVFSGIGQAAIIAIVAIFVILLLQFNSFRNSLIILLTVPLAFLGSLVALKVGGFPISFAAGLGLTALMGIVVNNGILLLSYIKEYEKQYDHLSEVCYLAIKRRLRPIVLSNTTTAIGLIPLIINGGSLFTPMALALAGGIVVGTVLTIFVVPSIYYLLNIKRFNKAKSQID